jgi:hypothetical protein
MKVQQNLHHLQHGPGGQKRQQGPWKELQQPWERGRTQKLEQVVVLVLVQEGQRPSDLLWSLPPRQLA